MGATDPGSLFGGNSVADQPLIIPVSMRMAIHPQKAAPSPARGFLSAGAQFLAYALLGALLYAPSLHAQSLVITDCQGITRAVRQAKPESLNKVEVDVSQATGGPANGSDVTLTNSVTGETASVEVTNGKAVFTNLRPGTYSLAVAESNLQIGAIVLAPMGVTTVAGAAIVGGAVVAGGGAAAGAGVAIADEVDSTDSDDEDPVPPTPVPTQPPSPTPPPVEPTPTQVPDCNCDPDAEPTPIDDFFGDEAAARPVPVSPER